MPGERELKTAGVVFERLLTLREAADLLGLHWKTVEVLARRGQIPAIKIGKRWRFRISLLDEWLSARFGPARAENTSKFDAKLAAQPRRASYFLVQNGAS
ncbi:MAG: helix-turn-helix domain-containing protein [Terriglobales bacterium]